MPANSRPDSSFVIADEDKARFEAKLGKIAKANAAVEVVHQIREMKSGKCVVVSIRPNSPPKKIAKFETRQEADRWLVKHRRR
jgi:hypothetical protein